MNTRLRQLLTQKGIVPLEVLLVLIAMALVIFTGWYAWNGWHNTNRAYDTSLKTGNTTIQSNASSANNINPYYLSDLKLYQDCLASSGKLDLQTSACIGADGSTMSKPLPDPRGSSKSISLAQWGVRVVYTGSQALQASISSDGYYTFFNDAKTIALDNACRNETGSILRLAPTDNVGEGSSHAPVSDPAFQVQSHFPKTPTDISTYVDGYYYIYVGPQAACSENGFAVQRQTFDASIVKSLVPKLQAE